MTELSFLIELLLNHDLPKATKDLIAQRIKEVEANLIQRPTQPVMMQTTFKPSIGVPAQAPSTLALMAKHGDIPMHNGYIAPEAPPEPVAVIAQTQATAAAMQSRNQAIADSIAGKTDKATGRPRKW